MVVEGGLGGGGRRRGKGTGVGGRRGKGKKGNFSICESYEVVTGEIRTNINLM